MKAETPMMAAEVPHGFDFNGTGATLLVDKPAGWTSFDVVRTLRTRYGIRKIGHAGTLDPMATGLLILCTGPLTKSIGRFMDLEKEYSGTFELGLLTPSYDTETEVVERRDTGAVTEENVRTAVGRFVGLQNQLPPMYSAV
ncbi:MAG: tRNA pseudouridine(55) synthase, partial [Bacteroidota bacterium]